MQIIEKYKLKMHQVVQNFLNELTQIQVGKINASILKKIKIEYYNVSTSVDQLAKITNINSKTLEIEPWDISILNLIEKSIQKSDLGINPNNNGKVIHLIFPELTEEKRLNMVKNLKKMSENFKINIRNIRRDANNEIKKSKDEISKNEIKLIEENIQNLTNEFILEIENMAKNKQIEILKI